MKSRPSAFRALIFFVLAAMMAPAVCVAALSPKNYPAREATVMFEEAKGLLTSPALSADGLTLYVGSADRRLYAIDTFSGVVNWFLRLPAPIFSSPTIDDND